MKNVIVTGANGFVGTWLTKELIHNNINVVAVVKDQNENITMIQNLRNVQIVYCKLDNLSELTDKIDGIFDTFFHLAWSGSSGDDRADYTLQLKNVQWTLDAVAIASKLKCKRFIGAGTLAELDCGTYISQDGSTPNAVTCYGSAKIAAHYMSKAIANKIGIEHIWTYLSNVYGVGNYTNNFVNFASKKMITERQANFTTAEQYYDFVYISDVAQALYLLGEKGKNNFAYYIGSTKAMKLKEFIKKIRDCIDPAIIINFGSVPFNGISLPESAFDCSKLVEDTGYCPEISFDEGVATTIEWIKTVLNEC